MVSPSEAQDLDEDLAGLEDELREWWDQKNSGLGGADDDSMGDTDLWGDLPEIDSKTAAQAAPICEEHLDIDFDMSMIQEGGYESVDDFIDDLLPQLRERISDTQTQDDDSE
ncbi:hypothetical protein [Haloarcula marina]|uniref:hypothetical protein n=1 Tax=Haloarcula marina TaxID=2961574 RepID=UPI0020B6F304|nr:hypothetical protein [Halomicroarcula marina]